ncbi:hypothetical protein FOZ61_008963 [Perkinsus olseni]|uniref:Uncharacterized protein n=1 Tax=Perkinsus olseni TaxID=32597 RepID=A0A7J6M6A3_PEROL|nr:hypothetical protein FOZ61_008963 [Perkinsus olseni]KAF4668676.1 hypothetical protein FOL46_001853 [Perkinsus olseni]
MCQDTLTSGESPVPQLERTGGNVVSFNLINDRSSSAEVTLAIFKVSRSTSREESDHWMGQGQGVDYPLLLSSIFNNYFNGLPIVDKFEDACIGHFGVAEICLQGFSVFHRNRTMQIEIPILNAGEYHIEVWEQEDTTAHSEESSLLFVDEFKGHDVGRG